MLNDQSIATALRATIEHLQQQNLEQAKATIEVLDFERLLKPIRDPSKGHGPRFIDPADGFGTERVHETGDHIRACRRALASKDGPRALGEAEKAFARWTNK